MPSSPSVQGHRDECASPREAINRELLEALQNLHRIANSAAGTNPEVAAALKAARAAIAKATGESK